MLTRMTERDWAIVLEVFDAAQSRRGEPGHDDRKFLEALVSVREVSESFESVAVGRRAPLEPIESPVIHSCAPSREVLYVDRREPCPLRPQQAALPQ